MRRRLVDGDPAAWVDTYQAHARAVYSVAYRIVGDAGYAEDVLQEVFLALWERPTTYDPERGSLRAWLCAGARHRAIDLLRRAEVRGRYLPVLAGSGPAPDTTEDAAMRTAVAGAVRSVVRQLPEPYREPILLAYYGGLTYRQVAVVLGTAEGTTKSRLRLALRRIRKRLKDDGVI